MLMRVTGATAQRGRGGELREGDRVGGSGLARAKGAKAHHRHMTITPRCAGCDSPPGNGNPRRNHRPRHCAASSSNEYEGKDNETMPSAESTFRNYTAQDGAQYAKGRFDYHPTLYNLVLQHHLSTGGGSALVLDVGCGPGNAARALAGEFDRAMGLDPSAGMIAAAKELGGSTKSGRPVEFVVSGAAYPGRRRCRASRTAVSTCSS